MPSDVVIASGTKASVGKEAKKDGGSWYQAYIAEAEWDFWFFFFFPKWGEGCGAAVTVGCGSPANNGSQLLEKLTFDCLSALDRPGKFNYPCPFTLPPLILPFSSFDGIK